MVKINRTKRQKRIVNAQTWNRTKGSQFLVYIHPRPGMMESRLKERADHYTIRAHSVFGCSVLIAACGGECPRQARKRLCVPIMVWKVRIYYVDAQLRLVGKWK